MQKLWCKCIICGRGPHNLLLSASCSLAVFCDGLHLLWREASLWRHDSHTYLWVWWNNLGCSKELRLPSKLAVEDSCLKLMSLLVNWLDFSTGNDLPLDEWALNSVTQLLIITDMWNNLSWKCPHEWHQNKWQDKWKCLWWKGKYFLENQSWRQGELDSYRN